LLSANFSGRMDRPPSALDCSSNMVEPNGKRVGACPQFGAFALGRNFSGIWEQNYRLGVLTVVEMIIVPAGLIRNDGHLSEVPLANSFTGPGAR
jgi:hypothetical protein